jgi:hypothetical protein
VRFLIDADLPRSAKALLEKHGHEAIDVRDVGLRKAKDPVIARYAQDHRACLLTGDFGFADIRNYPPAAYAGIAVLELPRDASTTFILAVEIFGLPVSYGTVLLLYQGEEFRFKVKNQAVQFPAV